MLLYHFNQLVLTNVVRNLQCLKQLLSILISHDTVLSAVVVRELTLVEHSVVVQFLAPEIENVHLHGTVGETTDERMLGVALVYVL